MHRLRSDDLIVRRCSSRATNIFRAPKLSSIHIENSKVKRGSVIVFSLQEINSWARYKVPEIVPQGIRNQRVTLGNDTGTAYALMDFLKMRHAEGKATGWIMSSFN